jgi:hypothetical protein
MTELEHASSLNIPLNCPFGSPGVMTVGCPLAKLSAARDNNLRCAISFKHWALAGDIGWTKSLRERQRPSCYSGLDGWTIHGVEVEATRSTPKAAIEDEERSVFYLCWIAKQFTQLKMQQYPLCFDSLQENFQKSPKPLSNAIAMLITIIQTAHPSRHPLSEK